MDNVWLGRFLQIFGPALAAWSAFLAFVVHLKKVRNAEKAAEHGRLLAEIDRLISERDVVSEERDMVRDKWAECEAEKIELMGRAVTAEATLLGIGMGRNEAATIIAAERIAQNAKPSDGNGGGG